MDQNIQKKLAESLTAETTELIPYLPDLLQDLWELGSDPELMIRMFQAHIPYSRDTRVLDLACGKGAVSVRLAKALQVQVKGIDLLPEFIGTANEKAEAFGVGHLCSFQVGDINRAVLEERDYDCVIFGAVGGVLGSRGETLSALKGVIRPGGYILIDDAYQAAERAELRFEHDYPTLAQWRALFRSAGLREIELVKGGDLGEEQDMANITRRAMELSERYPEKRSLFENYLESQRAEYQDLSDGLVGTTWLLQA